MKPTGKLQLECLVDADFSELYCREPDDEPNAIRSRTGYLISVFNFCLSFEDHHDALDLWPPSSKSLRAPSIFLGSGISSGLMPRTVKWKSSKIDTNLQRAEY